MTARHRRADRSWAAYLRRFHADRPGITERILARCRADGLDPYGWCAQALPGGPGPILDVACGSGPMADRLGGWVGADTSPAELALAATASRGPVVLASATRLPVASGVLDAAVCTMGVQVIDPVADALSEMARVVRPGAPVVLLVPAGGPLPWRDALRYLRLQAALRRRIGYPNDQALAPARLRRTTADVGLRWVRDDRRSFALPLRTHQDVDELLASLYLPGVAPRRLAAGHRALAGGIGEALAVPLRRIVLERCGAP